jgi:hypothetical protein
MEVKLLFGSHIWDVAQHADALGKRTHELRMPAQHSLPPVAEYQELLREVDAIGDTGLRIAAFYDAILPGVGARLRAYLELTDDLMDGPTVRIIDRILYDHARMIREARNCARFPVLRPPGEAIDSLRRRESGLGLIGSPLEPGWLPHDGLPRPRAARGPARSVLHVVHQHHKRYMPTAEAPYDATGREGLRV